MQWNCIYTLCALCISTYCNTYDNIRWNLNSLPEPPVFLFLVFAIGICSVFQDLCTYACRSQKADGVASILRIIRDVDYWVLHAGLITVSLRTSFAPSRNRKLQRKSAALLLPSDAELRFQFAPSCIFQQHILTVITNPNAHYKHTPLTFLPSCFNM